MSQSQVGPSIRVAETRPNISPENAAQFENFLRKESKISAPVDSLSSWVPQHGKYLSTDGPGLPLRISRTSSDILPLKRESDKQLNEKVRSYQNVWRSNFVLSLDGGGVRGYSQLIIIKALMDKVALLERAERDKNGNLVESSFHPLPWEDDKTWKQKRLPRNGTLSRSRATNGTMNGNGHLSDNAREKQLEVITTEDGRQGQFYPYHYFDWIAGTSTGGLNAIMLGRLRMSVDECLKNYANLAKQVFGKPRWASYRCSPLPWFCAKYSKNRLKKVVKQVVDEHLCEGEGHQFAMNKNMCRTVVVAMKKNIQGHEMAHLFRTYDHHVRRKETIENKKDQTTNPLETTGPADSSLIWEVARATSAAPTYFSTITIGEDEYGDGGFGENNPSTRIFWEVSQMNHDFDGANAFSVSIGTGISRFSRFQNGLFKRPIGWINAAKKVSTDCENGHIEMCRITKMGEKYKYHRFNVPEKATDPDNEQVPRWEHIKASSKKWFGHGGERLDRGLGKIKLDEWKSQGIWRKESTEEEIARITREYLSQPEVNEELDLVARAMVDQRRARAVTSRWAAYALGIRYECPVMRDRCPFETSVEESELRRHLLSDHGYSIETPEAEATLDQAIKEGKYFEHHH